MSLLLLLHGAGDQETTATATWEQTAGWSAEASERFTGIASFEQATASWDADALQRLTATAEWTQDAGWAASVTSAADIIVVGDWQQPTAAWTASVTAPPSLETVHPGRSVITRIKRRKKRVYATATFEQPASSWAAILSVRPNEIEDLIIASVI